MKYLLSLPENAAKSFSFLKDCDYDWETFSDPPDSRLGSGGGTSWLLNQSYNSQKSNNKSFKSWLEDDKRILVHAGGLSRRLPAYAPVGKSLIPIPVYRWARGQRLDQTLIDLQLPLAEKLLESAPHNLHTLVISGDALISSIPSEYSVPDADVVFIAVSADPSVAMNHGVFVCNQTNPNQLLSMLQKPSRKILQQVALEHLFFIDTGMWLLSDKAVSLLMDKCGWNESSRSFLHGIPDSYDLYGEFGLCLGIEPTITDEKLNSLSVAVLPLSGGEFLHFGTSAEIISSSLELQNEVVDQRFIWSRNIKPHPSIFTQNAIVECPLDGQLHSVWIENSYLSSKWKLHNDHVITGIPQNDWSLELPSEVCLDMIPVNSDDWVIRPYGMHDSFRGSVLHEDTCWFNKPLHEWFSARGLDIPTTSGDIHEYPLFPVVRIEDDIDRFIQWLLSSSIDGEQTNCYKNCKKVSSQNLLSIANLTRLEKQRKDYRRENYIHLGNNYRKSVFHQIDLRHAAKEIDKEILGHIPEPQVEEVPLLAMHDRMLRSIVTRNTEYEKQAFSILQESILTPIRARKVLPSCTVYRDQIVWSRSPVRIDLAGGWTDTPPHSLLNGGDVVTVALELNGQPPLQAYIRPIEDRKIILRSIDQGSQITIHDFKGLEVHNDLGSGFSIPKSALCLSGFHPDYCSVRYPSLQKQLDDIGSGYELTFFSAVPRGSGLGTSSILSATILGALSDFCGLGWDLYEIGDRALALEQLLTSGGGWQDQYGGILPGVKSLHTERGIDQRPNVRWLPDTFFTKSEYLDCMVLYYTGITRVAKNLLGEIVKGMFLNDSRDSLTLAEMKTNAYLVAEMIQKQDFQGFGEAIDKTWKLKNRLDKDTNNPEIQQIIDLIDDYALGYILPGAGGGGYLFIVGRDRQSASIIKERLNSQRTTMTSRVVDIEISDKGLNVTRS
jgi:galactokinase/mevalonate kinase-like predicted kinase